MREIFQYIEDNKNKFCKIKFIAEPYDYSSLELCSEFKIFDSYKLPTSDLSNLNLVEKILKYTKTLYLGTGGSNFEEISKTINFIKSKFNDVNIKLIHGFQAYPTNIEDMDLWKINFLKNHFSLKVGFADHADASSDLLRYLPSCIAIAAVADFIEKHITLNREEKQPDFYSSLNPYEISEFIFAINQTQKLIIKSDSFGLSKNENNYRKSMKKFACTATKIPKGHKLNFDNLSFKTLQNVQIEKKRKAIELGIPENKIILTKIAANTFEEAEAIKELLTVDNINKVIIVTSSFHIPRTEFIFRKQGISADSFPVDFKALGYEINWTFFFPSAHGFYETSKGIREYIGRLYYYLKQ